MSDTETVQDDNIKLRQRNTRTHWALYALHAWESQHGREMGATPRDIWEIVGGEESVIWKSIKDSADALRQTYNGGFTQRRTLDGEWDGPELLAYRLTERGKQVLSKAGKPHKKPARREEGYNRELPVNPTHEIPGGVVEEAEGDEEKDWLHSEDPDDWIETEKDRTHIRDEGSYGLIENDTSFAGRQIIQSAGEIARYFKNFNVIITVGPHRGHDVMYRLDPERKRINLDYYSVRPGTEHTDLLKKEIQKELEK